MLAKAAELCWLGLPTSLYACHCMKQWAAPSSLRISSICRHGKNVNSDAWRNLQLWRHLSNPEHPMNRFSTGNIATLMDTPTSQGISVHERVSCAACTTPLQGSTLGPVLPLLCTSKWASEFSCSPRCWLWPCSHVQGTRTGQTQQGISGTAQQSSMLATTCSTQPCQGLHLRQCTLRVLSGRGTCLQHSTARIDLPPLP